MAQRVGMVETDADFFPNGPGIIIRMYVVHYTNERMPEASLRH